MGYSIKAILKTNKERKDGTLPVYICVTIDRKRTYKDTGISLKPEQWNTSTGRIIAHPNSALLNAKINKKITDLEKGLLKQEIHDKPVSIMVAKTLLTPGYSSLNFISYAQQVLDTMKTTGSAAGTIRVYTGKLANLKSYAPHLSFNDVTVQFLNKYYVHLIKSGQQHNTTISSFKFMKLVMRRAIDEGLATDNPFTDFKYPSYKEPLKNYLTQGERKSLEDLLYKKNSLDTYHTTVLAYFLIECYTGIRHSDWAKIKTERILNNDNIYLNTTKTGERITIPYKNYPSLKKVLDYIKKNNIEYTYTLEAANRALKAIQAIAGIQKKLTTHVGRHTAATLLLEAGLSMESVAQVLGVSMRVVNTYAKITGKKIADEFLKMKKI